MREIVEYQIERANTTGELVSIIHRAMDHGWQPLGAPFFSSGGMAHQAIVKYATEKADPKSFKDDYRRIGDIARDAGLI